MIEDLKYCAQLDTLDVLPMQREAGVLVKSDFKIPSSNFWVPSSEKTAN
jgi:2-phosphosulfolactate phosphatase